MTMNSALNAVETLSSAMGAKGVAKIAEPAIKALAKYKFGDSREPLTVVEDLVRASAPSPEQGAYIAAQLASHLKGGSTFECKQFVCRQLVFVGTADQVPVLAKLLTDDKTTNIARYALEVIQGPEADDALIKALPKTSDAAKVGIINSLGTRRSAKAVDVLHGFSGSSNEAIATAAKAALTKIG